MEGFTLDSNTVKDCAEPAAAVNASSRTTMTTHNFQHHAQKNQFSSPHHFRQEHRDTKQMVFQDSERCESTCDSALGSECLSSVRDSLQGLHIANAGFSAEKSDFLAETSEHTVGSTSVSKKRAAEDTSEDIVLTSDAYDQDEEGDTPLSQSIIYERPAVALKFIKYTPDASFFNIRNCLGQTALMLSVFTNQHEICRALVVGGASVDIQDREGNTALHLACRFNKIQCVQALTAPINPMEVKKYLSSGNHRQPQNLTSQFGLKNYEGLTCLHLATLLSNISLLEYLVSLGADVDEPDGKSGRTALHYAVEMNEFNLVQCLLSTMGANVDAVTFDLCTPLHLAAGRGYEDIAYMLHGAGADTQVQNFEGQYACELTNNEELRNLLIPTDYSPMACDLDLSY